MIVAGLALFARAPVDGSYVVDVLPTMLLLGVGAGLSFPSLMTLAMSAPPRATPVGFGSGEHRLQVGRARLAVLATLSATRTDNLWPRRGDQGRADGRIPPGLISPRAWWRWPSHRHDRLQAEPAVAEAEEGAASSPCCPGGLGVDRCAHLGRRRLNVEPVRTSSPASIHGAGPCRSGLRRRGRKALASQAADLAASSARAPGPGQVDREQTLPRAARRSGRRLASGRRPRPDAAV